MNLLEKFAIAVDATCSVEGNAGNSGSDEIPQGELPLQKHAHILSGDSNKFRSIESRSHLTFCEEVAA